MSDDSIPFFSVIIPVYNKEPHIERCLKSVLEQTFADFELIVINDPSTDRSAEMVSRFSDDRMRVYCREEPGPGGYAARNLGIRSAKAKHIAFLDADDEWLPDHLERMKTLVEMQPEAVLYSSGFQAISGQTCTYNKYYLQSKSKGIHLVNFKSFLEIFLERNNRFCNTCVLVVKAEVIRKMGCFPEGRTKKGGDLYLFMRAMSQGAAAWSPHIGARIYHDAVNKVTQSQYFNPQLLRDMALELQPEVGADTFYLLKRYANHLLLKDYLRYKGNKGKPNYNLLSYAFYTNPVDYGACVSAFIIPGFMLKLVNQVRKAINGRQRKN